MAVAGVIAEYNPFHRGHQHQLSAIRQRLGEDTAVIAVMSGNVVQRGDLALVEKRAEEVLALVKEPMTASEINAAACKFYELFTTKTSKGLYLERNVRFLVEYLVETGRLDIFCQGGMVYYRRSK